MPPPVAQIWVTRIERRNANGVRYVMLGFYRRAVEIETARVGSF